MNARHVLRLRPLLAHVPLSLTPRRRFYTLTNMAFNHELPTPTETPLLERSTSSLMPGHDIARRPIPRRGVDYRGKVVLAPMVRSGELPSRLLALKYGADLVWGPETIDKSMIGTTKRTNPRTGCIEWSRTSHDRETVLYRFDPAREGGKSIFQIGTNDPARAVEASKLFAEHVSGIDVNAGCPKPFSTEGGMGARLLRTPDLLASILKALVREVGEPYEIGISVKIRLLETPELTSELVNKLCETGITGLTIHCRTTPMRPRQRAIRDQLRMIGDICRQHGVACLMNGDVTSREEGLELAKEFGVDGGMIATAAEANSSVFRSKEQGGPLPWREVVGEYLKLAMSVENKWGNTKFLLSQLMPGKSKFYQAIQTSKCYSEAVKVLEFEDTVMGERAKEVDHIMELHIPKTTKHDIKRQNKAENRAKFEAGQARRKAETEQNNNKRQRNSPSPDRSKKQKAEIAAENAALEGIGQGAMAVAV